MTRKGGSGLFLAALAMAAMAVLAAPRDARADATQGWNAYADHDYVTAARLWREDAAKGDPNAAFGLAILADRDGDAKASAGWYEKAAKGGLPSAQVLIGQRYAEGQGVDQDAVRAYAWYTRAMASGVPNAQKLRDRLATGMSAEQIKSAEALVETLTKR